MHKRVNFNPFEYPVHCVGIVMSELDRLLVGFKLKYQQAARLIRERTGKDHTPLCIERFQIG